MPVVSGSGWRWPQRGTHVAQMLGDGGQQQGHIRESVVQALALPDLTGKVHQQPVGTAPTDLDTDGKRAVRIQCQRNRGLTDAAPHRAVPDEKLVFFKPGGDQANGLCRQTGEPGQIRLGQAAIEANGL